MSLSIDASRCTGEIQETHKDTTIVPVQQTQEHEEIEHAAATTNNVPRNPRIMHGEQNELQPRRSNLGPNDNIQVLEQSRDRTCGHRTHVERSRRNMRIQGRTMPSLCAANLLCYMHQIMKISSNVCRNLGRQSVASTRTYVLISLEQSYPDLGTCKSRACIRTTRWNVLPKVHNRQRCSGVPHVFA